MLRWSDGLKGGSSSVHHSCEHCLHSRRHQVSGNAAKVAHVAPSHASQWTRSGKTEHPHTKNPVCVSTRGRSEKSSVRFPSQLTALARSGSASMPTSLSTRTFKERVVRLRRPKPRQAIFPCHPCAPIPCYPRMARPHMAPHTRPGRCGATHDTFTTCLYPGGARLFHCSRVEAHEFKYPSTAGGRCA